MVSVIMYLSKGFEKNASIVPFLGVYALAAYRIVPSITRISNYLQEMKVVSPAIEPYLNIKTRVNNNSNESKININNGKTKKGQKKN